jgi:RNA polymerase sigma factor (sigma-70 family)
MSSCLHPAATRGAIRSVRDRTTRFPQQRFATTRWTVVLAAGGDPAAQQTRDAMSSLAHTYWFPLYGFVRRQGYSAQDAEDLTQEFIARLIEKQDLADIDPAKGRFRSFLLASLRHFLSNQRDRERAIKRGGDRNLIALDQMDAEARYQLEPATDVTPERLFDRRWALALLDQVFRRLRDDYARTGRTGVYDALKPVLLADPDVPTYAILGQQLAMSETAIKVAVHRLRTRFRQLLREEVAQTVAADADLDAELNDLLNCL